MFIILGPKPPQNVATGAYIFLFPLFGCTCDLAIWLFGLYHFGGKREWIIVIFSEQMKKFHEIQPKPKQEQKSFYS